MQTVKDIIIVISIFSQILFFCVCQLFGYSFEGSDSSPIFKLSIMIIGVVSNIIVLGNIVSKKIHTGTVFWFTVVFLPLAIIADYLLECSSPYIDKSYAASDLMFILAFCFTSILSAIYVSERGILAFSKWIEIVIHIITLSSIFSTISIMSGSKALIGGSSYQVMSYYCAFAFCLNLCYILFGDRMERLHIFKTNVYSYISYLFLIIQLVGCLISGGRGGFVLLAVSSMYMLYLSKKIMRISLITVLMLSFVYTLSSTAVDNPFSKRILQGTDRVFSYISDDGIDMKKTSSRDFVYGQALKQIQEDHYLGRGLFRADADFKSYPHNMFLEYLMQGGLIYMLIMMAIIVFAIIALHFKLIRNKEFLIVPIITYPLVMLQFSESYLHTQLFWFSLTYIFSRKNIC